MRYHLQILILFIAFGVILNLSSCNKGEEGQLTPASTNIFLSMLHTVNGDLVKYDSVMYTNAYGNKYSIARLQYFISDIVLMRNDGKEVFIDEEFYIDGRDYATHNHAIQTSIPLGDYIAVSFVFGLSEEKNVAGRYPNPPENNMEWPPALGTGYHYMKLEGKIDSSGTIKNFQAHTGPTFGNQNYIEVSLQDLLFSISEKEIGIGIHMDINKWWENPNTIDLNTMTMIMGNQPMQEILQNNGGDVFSYNYIMYSQ